MSDLTKAILLLGVATDARFDLLNLSGDRYTETRVEIMRTLTGTKVQKSYCGINAVQRLFFAQAKIPANCYAQMADDFRDFCEGICKTAELGEATGTLRLLAAKVKDRREKAARFRESA